MPSVSEKQARFFAAVAHNRQFAKRAGVSQTLGKEWNQADKGSAMLSNAMRHRAKGGRVPNNQGGAALAARAFRLAQQMAKEQEQISDAKEDRFAMGGMPEIPAFVRSEMRDVDPGIHPPGLVSGSGPGRTDTVPTRVPSGSYILPADVVAGLGHDNSQYGWQVVQKMMNTGPFGTPLPRIGHAKPGLPNPPGMRNLKGGIDLKANNEHEVAAGGSPGGSDPVDVKLANGEVVLHPEQVAHFGGGDVDRGHKVLDGFVMASRKKHIDTLRKLPKPKKADEV